jgi:hypothetical protein
MITDFYLEVLILYLQNKESHVIWPNSTSVSVWDDFKKGYPTIAKNMEKWLEQEENKTENRGSKMKIIQIVSEENNGLTVLTDNGRIFSGYWKDHKFYWTAEITPNEYELTRLPLKVIYEKDQDD